MIRQSATFTWCHPIACAGIGGWDVLVMIQGSGTYTLFRLEPRSPALTAIPTGTARWYSPLIDAGERDKDKAWRKIGCVFADPLPMPTGSADTITLALDYSVDAGETWLPGATVTLTGDTHAHHNLTLDAAIGSASAVSRFVMLRVTWSGLTDRAPTLVDAWTEFEMLDSPARRRKWMLALTAADQTIDRDGAVLAMTGRQLVAALWNDWQGGTTLPFRDIDYDAAPVTRNVRITGIEEDAERPSDAGRWGQSVIRLTLVEV